MPSDTRSGSRYIQQFLHIHCMGMSHLKVCRQRKTQRSAGIDDSGICGENVERFRLAIVRVGVYISAGAVKHCATGTGFCADGAQMASTLWLGLRRRLCFLR